MPSNCVFIFICFCIKDATTLYRFISSILLSPTAVACLCKWQRYSEAEKALEKVLELDQNCKEASKKLFNCRVLQLMVRNVTSDFRVLG